jgi:hypothetical protein
MYLDLNTHNYILNQMKDLYHDEIVANSRESLEAAELEATREELYEQIATKTAIDEGRDIHIQGREVRRAFGR